MCRRYSAATARLASYTQCMRHGGGGGGGVVAGALAYYNSSFGVVNGLRAGEDGCAGETGSSAPTEETLAAGGGGGGGAGVSTTPRQLYYDAGAVAIAW